MLLIGTTDGFANIHAPNERVLLDEFEKASLAEASSSPYARPRRGAVVSATRPAAAPAEHTFLERILDGIERAGNKMPHPAILFLWLCVGVIVLSQVLYWFDVKATFEVVKPPAVATEETYYGGSIEPSDVGPTSRSRRATTGRHRDGEGEGPADRRRACATSSRRSSTTSGTSPR
jgi:hypothetical protein